MPVPKQETMRAVIRIWLPLVVSVGVNVYLVGFKLGSLETRLQTVEKTAGDHARSESVHMPLERKLELFVSRREYEAQKVTREAQIVELRGLLLDQGRKLDRILERMVGGCPPAP